MKARWTAGGLRGRDEAGGRATGWPKKLEASRGACSTARPGRAASAKGATAARVGRLCVGGGGGEEPVNSDSFPQALAASRYRTHKKTTLATG